MIFQIILNITNGIHYPFYASRHVKWLYTKYIPGLICLDFTLKLTWDTKLTYLKLILALMIQPYTKASIWKHVILYSNYNEVSS